MTDHQKVQPEILLENIQQQPSSNSSVIAGSIIIGAILISASVFYNTKLLIKYFDNLQTKSLNAAAAVIQAQGGDLGNQQAAAPSDVQGAVQVPERKDAAVLGSKSAKVTMVEFSDFQCPFCVKFFKETYGQIKSKYIDTGKVKLVFRHYPLPFHQNAQKAAEAAECANRQGKFFEYHDLLFENSQSDGSGLAIADLKKYADQLGLNKGTLGFGKDKFNQCLDKGEAAETVKKDVSDAQSAGISGTPSFFVNGKKIVGAQPFSSFEQAIEEALKK